jgi:hypothetical protein
MIKSNNSCLCTLWMSHKSWFNLSSANPVPTEYSPTKRIPVRSPTLSTEKNAKANLADGCSQNKVTHYSQCDQCFKTQFKQSNQSKKGQTNQSLFATSAHQSIFRTTYSRQKRFPWVILSCYDPYRVVELVPTCKQEESLHPRRRGIRHPLLARRI